MFKTKGGYDLTVSITEDGLVLHEDVLDKLVGLGKGGMIVRKKGVNLNDKALMFTLNVFNDKINKSKK